MSIWRSLAIVVLVSCSGAAAPRSPLVSTPAPAPAPPGAEAANPAGHDTADPAPRPSGADDPACTKLADADPAGDASASSAGSEDGDGDAGPRRKKLPPINACSVARVNFTRDAEAIRAAAPPSRRRARRGTTRPGPSGSI